MNIRVLLFAAVLLLIPSISSADKAYTVQCADSSLAECTVKSAKKIRAVRIEVPSGDRTVPVFAVKNKFGDCPPEVSVTLKPLELGGEFFIETCDGSNGTEVVNSRLWSPMPSADLREKERVE